MTVVIDLPTDLEDELKTEAAQLKLPLPDYVVRLLAAGRTTTAKPRNGAELVAYWQAESLIGTRRDIPDSLEHARALRRRAERRDRS